jgi:hypothetical protein
MHNYTFVNFKSGNCGEFVISLIILMHDKARNTQMQIEEAGSCHNNRTSEPELIANDTDSWQTPNNIDHHYAYLDKFNTITAPVCKTHLESVDLPQLMEHYPNSSVINIISDDPDQVARNVIFKTLIPTVERDIYGGNALKWMLEKLGLPITDDITALTINEFNDVYSMIKDKNTSDDSISNTSDKYYAMQLSEILNNKKSLLVKLSSITGHPITKEAEDFYDLYIAKQPTLRDMEEFQRKLRI